MLGLLLDAAVIIGLVYYFNDGEVPGWGTAILTALAIGLGFYGCVYFLSGAMGLFSLAPMAIVAGVLLWIACDVPLKKAIIAGVILLVYKILFVLLIVSMMG